VVVVDLAKDDDASLVVAKHAEVRACRVLFELNLLPGTIQELTEMLPEYSEITIGDDVFFLSLHPLVATDIHEAVFSPVNRCHHRDRECSWTERYVLESFPILVDNVISKKLTRLDEAVSPSHDEHMLFLASQRAHGECAHLALDAETG